LLEQSGKPAAEVARELGVRRNQLYKWQAQTTALPWSRLPWSRVGPAQVLERSLVLRQNSAF
jgi:transposase-like protein